MAAKPNTTNNDKSTYVYGGLIPWEWMFSDDIPLKYKLMSLLALGMDKEIGFTKWELARILRTDQDKSWTDLSRDEQDSHYRRVHDALKPMMKEGIVRMRGKDVTLVVDQMTNIPMGHHGHRTLGAILKKKACKPARLRERVVASRTSCLKDIHYHFTPDQYQWLWDSGAFENPSMWTKVFPGLVDDRVIEGLSKCLETFDIGPVEYAICAAVEAAYNHSKVTTVRSPFGLVKAMLTDMAYGKAETGHDNQTLALIRNAGAVVRFAKEIERRPHPRTIILNSLLGEENL